MATHGPIEGTNYGLPTTKPANPERSKRLGTRTRPPKTPTAVEVVAVPNRPVVDPPSYLLPSEKKMFAEFCTALPMLDQHLDGPNLARVCQLFSERARHLANVRKIGELISEPIVSPNGRVVGERCRLQPLDSRPARRRPSD